MMAFSDSNSDGVQSSNSFAISLAYILVTVGTFALRIESADTCRASSRILSPHLLELII